MSFTLALNMVPSVLLDWRLCQICQRLASLIEPWRFKVQLKELKLSSGSWMTSTGSKTQNSSSVVIPSSAKIRVPSGRHHFADSWRLRASRKWQLERREIWKMLSHCPMNLLPLSVVLMASSGSINFRSSFRAQFQSLQWWHFPDKSFPV